MLLDTSAIIEIFRNPSESSVVEKIMSELENEDTYVSIVQLAEVADWAARNKVPPRDRINVVKELARTVPLDEPICLDAAVIKRERRKAGHTTFGLVDGIILATARSLGQQVLTFDRDFTGEDDCILMS